MYDPFAVQLALGEPSGARSKRLLPPASITQMPFGVYVQQGVNLSSA
jgi:hypothetical protein